MFQVYTIEFSDGSTYVGSCRSERGYQARYREHCKSPVNKLLDHKIRDLSLSHELCLVGEYATHAEAIAAEREIALSLELPINVYEPTTSGIGRFLKNSDRLPRDHIPDLPHRIGKKRLRSQDRIANSTLVRCSRCRKRLPASEFPDDRSRHNGIYSQCYDCRNQALIERRQSLIDQQRCYQCQQRIPEIYAAKQHGDAHLCEQCASKCAAKSTAVRHARASEGRCPACGKTPLPNRKLCGECLSYALDYQKNVRLDRAANNLCRDCGSPELAVTKGGKTLTACQPCREKRNQRERERRRAAALRVSH